MADELTERGLDLLRQSFGWARDGDAAHISELLDMGASPDLTNEHGDTLLILAAYHCQMDTVRLLLQREAAVDRMNDNGQTALGAAVFRRAADIVVVLLDRRQVAAAGSSACMSARSKNSATARERLSRPEEPPTPSRKRRGPKHGAGPWRQTAHR